METPEEYAQRRANETGKRYVVSDFGHALCDCRWNRRMLREIGHPVALVFTPDYRLATRLSNGKLGEKGVK